MGNSDQDAINAGRLRSQAEAWLAHHPHSSAPVDGPLLHELQVHQVELEIQNEELRAAQSQLSLAWEEYLDLYEHAPVGYCTLTEEGQVIKVNQTLALLWGVDPQHPLGKNLTTFAMPEGQDQVYLFLRNLRSQRTAGSLVVPMRRGAGDSFWSRLDARRVEEGGRSVVRVVLNDITKERAEDEAIEINARLESLGTVAGGLAHDFNNLLGGIFGYLTLAKEAPGSPPAVVRYLEKAGAVFDRARSLTGQLLTFTKSNLPHTKATDLAPLAEKCASFILSGTETLYQVNADDRLRPALVDEGQFGQLVDNLVLNASQAMAGRGKVELRLQNADLAEGEVPGLGGGSYVKLSVTDTGVGIASTDINRIFTPFFTSKTHGRGLGLASVQSIVRKHGGAIWPVSVEGLGTSFHVLLPAAPVGACHEAETVDSPHRGHGTILIMDDEAFNLEVLSGLLKSFGYESLEARDGEEALRLYQTHPSIRAAFLDLTIKGGKSGLDTVGPMRTLFPLRPVFALSGYCEDPVIARPESFGFSGSLGKPYLKADLGALLARNLDQERSGEVRC